MNNIFTENIRGHEVKFKTKPGIFAKHGLDGGTRLLIEKMEVKDETVVADLGSGSGVLGFIASKLNPNGHVHLLDDHLRSVELAKENVQLNNLKNVEVYLSDLFSAVSERTYHQILSNPPQQLGNEFLEELIDESFKHLKPGGSLWLVVKNNIKPVVERIMKSIFKNSRQSFQISGEICKIIASSREHIVLKVVK